MSAKINRVDVHGRFPLAPTVSRFVGSFALQTSVVGANNPHVISPHVLRSDVSTNYGAFRFVADPSSGPASQIPPGETVSLAEQMSVGAFPQMPLMRVVAHAACESLRLEAFLTNAVPFFFYAAAPANVNVGSGGSGNLINAVEFPAIVSSSGRQSFAHLDLTFQIDATPPQNFLFGFGLRNLAEISVRVTSAHATMNIWSWEKPMRSLTPTGA